MFWKGCEAAPGILPGLKPDPFDWHYAGVETPASLRDDFPMFLFCMEVLRRPYGTVGRVLMPIPQH